MMITQAQLDDLRIGDVVRLTDPRYRGGYQQGPVWSPDGGRTKVVCGQWLTDYLGVLTGMELEVISRAPRPYYTNSDKLMADNGDVAKNVNGEMVYYLGSLWYNRRGNRGYDKGALTLIVDGVTGKVV
jgi:hypothetical protein